MPSKENNIANLTPEAARAVEEYLIKTGKLMAQAEEEPKVLEINGGQYLFYRGCRDRIREVHEDDAPQPEQMKVFSLSGLVDFIKADVEGMFADGEPRHIVRVVNERRVEVISPKIGYWQRRHFRVLCEAPAPEIRFGRYLPTEDFQVMMQTCFEECDNQKSVMTLAGTASREQSVQMSDDGMAQKVQVKTGVSLMQTVQVKNPVNLTPIRTFYEVEQPRSPFILRFDEEGKAALFEGDGGAWKLTAVQRIVAWLRKELEHENVAIIG